MEPQIEMFFQLILAALLGGIIGLEREYRGKAAGLRTYSLISLGAALFTIISLKAFEFSLNMPGANFDPSRIISQIIVGVGFIGGGVIMYHGLRIEGITTAVGIWISAGIGTATGVGFYSLAVFTTLLTIFVLAGLRVLEEKIIHKSSYGENTENKNS